MPRVAALVGAAAWVLFVISFDPGVPQWTDLLWLAALAAWVVSVRWSTGEPLLPALPSRGQVVPIGVLVALFSAAWLPFYDNWRWAYTGDSIAWFGIAEHTSRNGLGQSILSLHGVDGNFSFLHGLGFNSLMFVFEPTLFWHRVGKLIVSCVSLVAIYAFFTATVNRWLALAVAAATATNYVWLWFTYVSYGHIDSHIFYFLTLLCAVGIWRNPDRIGPWLACGLIGGLSMFFTQTAWTAVATVGLGLLGYGLATRRLRALVIYAVSFLLAATPVLYQFPFLIEMTTRQAGSLYEWDYLLRVFRGIVEFPLTSSYRHIGVKGGFMRPPLGQLYVAGGVLAAVAVVPALRRLLRVPAVAPILLGFLLWEAVLMTLTNNGYPAASTKRSFNLIPLQCFLAILPFESLYRLAPWALARRGVVAAAVTAIAIGAGGGLRQIVDPPLGLYGNNAFDGLIELRQRWPERHVRFLTSRKDYRESLAPGAFFHANYRLLDQLSVDGEFSAATVDRACAGGEILCAEPHVDAAQLEPFLGVRRDDLDRFPLLNSKELVCFVCRERSERGSPAGS